MKNPRLFEPRLLGTWRSDRLRTFRNYKPGKGQNIRKFKALFGKLTIRWTRHRAYTELDGRKDRVAYDVVARDRDSVVIRSFTRGGKDQELFEAIFGKENLMQIRFDSNGKYYSIFTQWGLIEWFRRLP